MSDQPGADQPGADQPTVDESTVDEPGGRKPGGREPESIGLAVPAGVLVGPDGTTFDVWAPDADRVELLLGADSERRVAMGRGADGTWSAAVPDAGHGTRYAYSVDGGEATPDPRSVRLPDGVHSPGEVYDHARFSWTDDSWAGTDPAATVAYELHVGTFTAGGTLDSAIDRLPHLVDLGVTLVELLPVAAFDGVAGWGYDGVGLWAVHEPYGGPDALKRFVDAAHAYGLGVCVDVVYNHFGPSGNYVARFGPYFTDRYSTPWGDAVNLDAAGSDRVREFVLGSAVQWLRDHHVDCLRLDATHAYYDPERAVSLLEELAVSADELTAATGVRRWLVAESELNDPRLTAPREVGGGGQGVPAQWADDVHHSLHALLTGESSGYYGDFAADPYAAVAKVATRVFFHDGTFSTFRDRTHGRPVEAATTSGARFWGYLQDHDQIGNRAVGDRLSATVPHGRLAAGAAVLFSLPFTPMLFMGEEWAAGTPWQFFTSFPDEELGEAVRNGRRSEFASHGWDVEDVPDPQSPQTVADSRLDWSELDGPEHRRMYEWYRTLLGLRTETADLGTGIVGDVTVEHDAAARWLTVRRGAVLTAAALGEDGADVPLPEAGTVTLLAAWDADASVDGSTLHLPGAGAAVLLLG